MASVKRLAIFVVLVLALAMVPAATSAAAGKEPDLDAKAWALIDARTGETLADQDADEHLPMASTTKMMTAYLTLRSLPMDRMVRAAKYVPGDPSESLMGLETGQKISVRDLLYGLIMLSGNDAAHTLAIEVSGSEERFVARMNLAAAMLGLDDTHFRNPIGLDAEGHYTSAADLAKLGRVLMDMPRFRPIAGARTAVLKSYDPPLTIENIDTFLLNNEWARGIKTGHTLKAGYVLASDGRRRATELIATVIGAPTEASRDEESVRLLDYGFSLYTKEVPLRQGKPFTSLPVKFEDGDLKVLAARSARIGVRKDERLKVATNLPDEVEGPVSKGERIGMARVTVDGDLIAAVPLRAAKAIAEPSLADRIRAVISTWWPLLLFLVFAILAVVVIVVRRRRDADLQRRLKRVARRQ